MIFSQEVQTLIDVLQMKMYRAIKRHHVMFLKFDVDRSNTELELQLREMQNEISSIGLEQREIIQRVRKEVDGGQKKEVLNGSWLERESSINNCLVRNRKQNIISRWRSGASGSPSDESLDAPPERTACEPPSLKKREELTQAEFLFMFGLVTHTVFKEMQNKRAERRRRSTVNPQFLYSARDYASIKRRRNKAYLQANFSPPNTRQSAKNKMKIERASNPSSRDNSRPSSPHDRKDPILSNLPAIPNLPSGLTIERVDPNRTSPDIKQCIICRLPDSSGPLSICESCFNGYHVACHNRPLVQTPRNCPKCIEKREVRTVGALNVPSGMSVSYVPAEVAEKIQEKERLLETHKSLAAEMSQLQERHAQLAVSLSDQKTVQETLLLHRQTTQDKIDSLLTFIETMKRQQQQQHVEAAASSSPTHLLLPATPSPRAVEIA